jgi:hypothetical protein
LGPLNGKYLEQYLGQYRNSQWRIHCNNGIYGFCEDIDVATHIKPRRLEWAGHICQTDGSRISWKILEGKIYIVVKQQGSQRTGRLMW